MAIAARYGHISPLDFEQMDFEEGKHVAERCLEMFHDEWEAEAELLKELTKAEMKSHSDTVQAIARGMAH
jgi:hypothetical protein